jgi:hypothetical protein
MVLSGEILFVGELLLDDKAEPAGPEGEVSRTKIKIPAKAGIFLYEV